MIKPLLIFLFILLSFNTVLGETINLSYTDTSNITQINIDYNSNNYTILALNDNEIYKIEQKYKFGTLIINEGNYISNISFIHNYDNITISENYNISDALFSKKVNYSLSIYKNNELNSVSHNDYYVFTTSCYFAKTRYIFLTDEIEIKNTYSDISGYNWHFYNLDISNNLIITNVNLTFTNISDNGRNIYIEWVYEGVKPKSYYIEKLNPILRLPYTLISSFDSDNNILNILLITTYILTSMFFWIKVLYTSMFTILIIILIAVIPFISLSQSNNRNDFINRLFSNYTKLFQIMLNIVKYMINLIIKLIELIPFI